MSETPTVASSPRMSADEAAAKADALIAQHRAQQKPARRTTAERATVGGGLRVAVLALPVLGVLAGLAWHAHPAIAAALGAVTGAVAIRVAGALPAGPTR